MRRNLQSRAAALRVVWAGLCLLALLASIPVLGAASTASGASGKTVLGIPLAIADFDGDKHPDLATVSIDGSNSVGTDYSIQFQFTGIANLSIGLTARGGGLDLVPQDVNGDKVTDLVVSTALDSKVVAVLVNDGHGNFSVASPGAFPFVSADASAFLREANNTPVEVAADGNPRSKFGEEAMSGRPSQPLFPSESLLFRDIAHASSQNLRVSAGRSPPAFFVA